MNTTRWLNGSMMAASFLFGACSLENGPAENLGQDESAVIGVDTFLYFRSNASGWGVDDSTRLFEDTPGVFRRRIEVDQPWMLATNDTATVLETNQLNGWGTQQTFYDLANTQVISVRSTEPLSVSPPGGDPHFQVDYPSLEPHQVTVDTNATPFELSIIDGGFACIGVSCPEGQHCEISDPEGVQTCVPDL
jgi:hypothetical protein